MKKLLQMSLIGALLGGAAFGQVVDEQAELKAKYDKKIAKEFVSFGNWILDYDVAREKAETEGKMLFTYFTRSYSP